jgi:hypothetical protein
MGRNVVSRERPYSPPTFREINREHAALVLLGQAWDGDENAKHLLEYSGDILFPTPPKNNSALS